MQFRVFSAAIAICSLAACEEASTSTPSTSADAGSPSDAATASDAGPSSPVTIGEGSRPGLAVDAAGTSYIAWYGPESTTNTLRFCRLPRGAMACDVGGNITALGTTLSRPYVFVSGTTVRVVSYRYGLTGDRFDAVYIYSSTDGGATFDSGRPIGTLPYSDVLAGPGDTFSFATDAYTQGEFFESTPTGATAVPASRALLSTDHLYSGAVGLIDSATPVTVFADASGNAQLRRYDGSGGSNDAANWMPAQDIGHGEYMDLAGGSSGLFLKARSADDTLDVRRFDGNTFGAAVTISQDQGEFPQSHLSQDPGGRLHAVWPMIAADGIRLYYTSSDDGTTWQPRVLVTSPDTISSMRVEATAKHEAVTVWEGPSKTIRLLTIR